MRIVLNGEDRSVDEGTTVAQIAHSVAGRPGGRGLAVAVNGEVTPRSAWDTVLHDRDRVEILAATQGG